MKLTIFATVFFVLVSCSPKIPTYSNQITNFPKTEDGTIYLQCTGAGSNKKAAYDNAIYNAFSAVLFQGVPASVQSRPMVDPANADNVRGKMDNCLKDIACYRNFITSISVPEEDIAEIKNGYMASPKIKINLRVLRTYLEQNNIIPKAFTF